MYAASEEAYDFVKNLIVHKEGPYYILLLPNKIWGVLWEAGINMEYADCIMDEQYDVALAFMGDKKEALEYVLKNLEELKEEDPLNYRFNINKIKSKFFRKNSKFNKLPD